MLNYSNSLNPSRVLIIEILFTTKTGNGIQQLDDGLLSNGIHQSTKSVTSSHTSQHLQIIVSSF